MMMTVAAVVMTVTAVVMVSMPAEPKAKARPEEEAAVVRIGVVVVVGALAPNAPAMVMATMPPAAPDPHDVLQSRVFTGARFQAIRPGGKWRSLDRRRQRAECERSGHADNPAVECHACLLDGA